MTEPLSAALMDRDSPSYVSRGISLVGGSFADARRKTLEGNRGLSTNWHLIYSNAELKRKRDATLFLRYLLPRIRTRPEIEFQKSTTVARP